MLRRSVLVIVPALSLLVAACGSTSSGGSDTASTGTGGGTGAGAGTSTGGTGAGATGGSGTAGSATSTGGTGAGATGGSGTAGSGTGGSGGAAWDPGGPVTTFTPSFAPVMTMPGQEQTMCITFPLENAGPVLVRRFSTSLASGTHHIILYRAPTEKENLTPTPCMGLSGLLTGSHPIFIAQQKHSELLMPTSDDGKPVALPMDAHEMVRMEMHFINTTAAPIAVSGSIAMDTLDGATTAADAWVRSDLAFWGTSKINIPAHGKGDTGVKFQVALPDTHTFALTTHQHHLGTSMKIWMGTSATDPNLMLLTDGTNWADPPLKQYSPPLSFPASSGLGFAYECQWDNPGDTAVKFGESANDEMCFLWHYYYPAKGFQLCVPEFGGCSVKLRAGSFRKNQPPRRRARQSSRPALGVLGVLAVRCWSSRRPISRAGW